jgi:uncharacterized protein (DUF2147 family)
LLNKMMQWCVTLLLSASLLAVATTGISAPSFNKNSAVGYWITLDHQDHNAQSSVIHIVKGTDGKYVGHIVHIFPILGHGPKDKCVLCKGKLHNAPILGLRLVWGFDKVGQGQYANGFVLDPTNGKTYHAKMWLGHDGEQLTLRGYIGVPLFGRSDVWLRTQPVK